MNDDDCYLFDCLRVSGARYANDLKGLRMKMKKMLQEEDYHRVFVHLGSNDVLCPLDVFYSTYCTYLIQTSDIELVSSRHVRHLSRDGLHLNADGGRLCFRTIQDNAFANYPVRADMSADVSLDIMQWPALKDNDLDIVAETVSVRRKTYASIVKEMPAVVTVFDECCSSDHMELKSCPRVVERYRKVRYFRRRSSRHARKLGKMVAKVSKLLLELEKGNISKYKGKTLDEIQFDLNEPLEEETEENDFLSNRETEEVPELMENETSLIAISEKKQDFVKISRKNKTSTRKPWSEEESAAVERQLGTFIYQNKLPGKHALVEAQRKEPVINGRPWSQIKFYIKNKKVSMKKKTN
ncbi:hypothetical protein ACF0H5_008181 [Mactra antiquata]